MFSLFSLKNPKIWGIFSWPNFLNGPGKTKCPLQLEAIDVVNYRYCAALPIYLISVELRQDMIHVNAPNSLLDDPGPRRARCHSMSYTLLEEAAREVEWVARIEPALRRAAPSKVKSLVLGN